ncbi:helix-turn-helix domain-containing protein [Neobacillus drentensis]|uniref:helix-turn-helix domain-containing protein n=1 Tax=Neobacillus drentensis TaxID=220684 RepID=UPI0030009E64
MFNRNQDIKEAKRNVPDWAIAEKLGISENSFYRWIRKELSREKKAIILRAIYELKQEIEKQKE